MNRVTRNFKGSSKWKGFKFRPIFTATPLGKFAFNNSMDFNEPNTKNLKPFSQNPPILDLPLHILSIIISFLPTKSIICCKLVCKLWCSVIKSPHFNLPSDRVTLLIRRYGFGVRNKDLYLVEPEVDFVMRDWHYVFYKSSRCLRNLAVTRFNGCEFDGVPVKMLLVVNSCNGLVCLASTGKKQSRFPEKKLPIGWGPLFVCNPVTSDYIVVQQLVGTVGFCLKRCGFGFSVKSKQFKVLRFKSDSCGDGPLVADIYTLGCDEEWRSIENPPRGYEWKEDPLFFEGSLHWVLSRENGSNKTEVTIVAFEFQEEKFSLVSTPNVSDDFYRIKEMCLAILHQRLCLSVWGSRVQYDCYGQCDVWAMNEYGVKESWKKLYIVDDTIGVLADPSYVPWKPLAFLNTGELLMLTDNHELISYNVKSTEMTAVEIPKCDGMEAMLFNPNFQPIKNLIFPPKAEHS